jgi:hypothetical protein
MNPDLTDTRQQQQQQQLNDMKPVKGFEAEDPNEASGGDDSDIEKPARRSGRRKIKIEYIEDKNRRHITFSKRKAGIMKKVFIIYFLLLYYKYLIHKSIYFYRLMNLVP